MKFDNIEFFDSTIKEEELLITIERYIFYKNIYTFINYLKNIEAIKEDNKVREILLTYFRNEALT